MPPRSWLLIPGDQPHLMREGFSCGAETLLFDLEDSVAEASKDLAREAVRAVLLQAPRPGPQLWVRINPLSSASWRTDVESVLTGAIDGLVLPKAMPADADRLSAHLEALEHERGIAVGSTGILAFVAENAPSVLALGDFAVATTRVKGFTWGVGDLAADLRALSVRDAGGEYTDTFRLARSLTRLAAATLQAWAIETAYSDLNDTAGFEAHLARARRDGFDGMIAVHASQVAFINRAFTPTNAELSYAQAVVRAFAHSKAAGTVTLDGKLLYAPHLAQARRILEWAACAPPENRE